VPTNVCSWWKSGRAADITAMTDFDPTRTLQHYNETCEKMPLRCALPNI
jgi:hypothetical protein